MKLSPLPSATPLVSTTSSLDIPSTSLPFIIPVTDSVISNPEKRYAIHYHHPHYTSKKPVYHSNGPSPISLVGASLINASSSMNKIKLPSIRELDNMITNPMPTRQPIAAVMTTKAPPQLPPIIPTTTTTTRKRAYSVVIVEQDFGITTSQNNRPFKRQNNESKKKPKPSFSKQQCHSCNSTETPEWRKGPLGPRTLCNACGLIWTKLCRQNNEEDNQSKKPFVTATSDASDHLTPLSSPTGSHVSSFSVSSDSKSSKNNSISCQKHTLSFLMT